MIMNEKQKKVFCTTLLVKTSFIFLKFHASQ